MNQNHPEVSIPTSTLEYHCLYTRTEFENSKLNLNNIIDLKALQILYS